MHRQPNRQGGFSLVEVLIASTLLATSVCWSVLLTVRSRELAAHAQETNVAAGILEAEMAELMTFDRVDLAGDVYEPNTVLESEEFFTDQVLLYETPGYEAGEPVPEILELSLTLTWTTHRGDTRTLNLRGLQK